MLITPLEPADWTVFKTLAAAEGWTLSFHEQRLFLNHWRPFFFTLKQHGDICGFVSAVTYKRSGWIGNLLVAPEKRGLGYGSALLEHAISSPATNAAGPYLADRFGSGGSAISPPGISSA